MINSEIAIVGASVTGLMMALSLGHYNISNTIVGQCRSANDIRNIALTKNSQKFLKKIGIWPYLMPYIAEIKNIYVLDNQAIEMLQFKYENNECNGYTIPYYQLYNVLLERIQQYTGIITQSCEASYHNAPIIIMCNSGSGRPKPFTSAIEYNYDETALVFNIRHDNPHDGTAIERFTYEGVFAALPLYNNYESGIVWSAKNKTAKILLGLNNNALVNSMLPNLPKSYGNIEIISDISCYPIAANIAKQYYHKNTILVGDSAHTIHPLAGQGLNQGIKDIACLSEIISEYRILGLGNVNYIGPQYANKRQLNNIVMFCAMHALDKIFINKIPYLSRARQLGLGVANKFESIKRKIINV